jgi:hypothetical protein
MIPCLFHPGDVVRLVSAPKLAKLARLLGQPSIVTHVDQSAVPPRFMVAVYDPATRDLERIRCRHEDLERFVTQH